MSKPKSTKSKMSSSKKKMKPTLVVDVAKRKKRGTKRKSTDEEDSDYEENLNLLNQYSVETSNTLSKRKKAVALAKKIDQNRKFYFELFSKLLFQNLFICLTFLVSNLCSVTEEEGCRQVECYCQEATWSREESCC